MSLRPFIAWIAAIRWMFASFDATARASNPEPNGGGPVDQGPIARAGRTPGESEPPSGILAEVSADGSLVDHPLDMDFDAQGRLWVLEQVDAQAHPGRSSAGRTGSGARLVRLTDTDGDGRFDSRAIQTEGIAGATSILVLESGIYIGHPDGVLWLQDTDGSGRSARRTEVFAPSGNADRGPDSPRPQAGPLEGALFANIDNWIYSPGLRARFRPVAGRPGHWTRQRLVDPEGSTVGADESGRLIHADLENGVRVEPVPLRFLYRNANHRPETPVFQRGGDGTGTSVPSPLSDGHVIAERRKIDRVDVPGRIRAAGTLVYRGDQLPSEFRGDLFICDAERGVIRRYRPSRGARRDAAGMAEDGEVFMEADRASFRPIRLRNGPDGSLYVLDGGGLPEARPELPHRRGAATITTPPIPRPSERSRGRVLRVRGRHGSGLPLAEPSPALRTWDIAARFTSTRGFWQDWAQRRWVEQSSPQSTRILEQWVSDHRRLVGDQESTPASVRLRALWALEGQGRISAEVLRSAMEDPDTGVRSATLQIVADLAPGPLRDEGMSWALQRSAAFPREATPSLLICLGSAATPQADGRMRSILLSGSHSVLLEDATISGLTHRELGFLGQLLADPQCGPSEARHTRLFRRLGECLRNAGRPEEIAKARDLIRGLPGTDGRVAGLNEGLLGPIAPGGARIAPTGDDTLPGTRR
ncbi:MAG: hypothetical protein RIT19_1666 [Verrucomicrobiota bacterium]|jgi:glucose/arabinose dehydrogenase